MVAISLTVSGKSFFCMRCSWCPVLSNEHYPAERAGAVQPLPWLGTCGCAASAPLHRGVPWLASASHGLHIKRKEKLNWEVGDTVVEFVY